MADGLRSKGLRLALAAGLLCGLAGPVHAGDDHDHDHDRARRALEAGEILPLRSILQRVERQYPGQIMEVELDRKDDNWLYKIKLLRTDGSLVKLRIDARDGRVLGDRVKGNADASGQRAR